MTNALVGYIIGKYASENGTYADFNEILGKGCNLDNFRTPEVERFLAIQQLVSQQDFKTNKAFSALQIQLFPLFDQLPDEDLPFYFLPLAYLCGATFEEVMRITSFLVSRLTTNQYTINQIMCLVSAVKWSLTTHCNYYPFICRCFPTMLDDNLQNGNMVREALRTDWEDGSTTTIRYEAPAQAMLRKACEEPAHAAIRCALVYALSEVYATGEYVPEVNLSSLSAGTEGKKSIRQNEITSPKEDFSQPFPLRPRITSHVDAHIIDGYYRLDGYVSWQMKPKKEPLLERSILGDETGPDRDELRFWNFCNKCLDWDLLAHELDSFFSLRSFLRVDWRSKLVCHEIQWDRRRVAFILDNDRSLSFVPDVKKKMFVLDKSEAKDAGIPRFRFGTRPTIQVLENLSDKLMGDDDSNL